LPSVSCALVGCAHHVHRIPPHVRDVASRPSCRVGQANCYIDLHFGKTEIFLFRGLATAGKSGITPARRAALAHREPMNLERTADVRFRALNGLKSDADPCPKSAIRDRGLPPWNVRIRQKRK
jgi:hypothetical protein